MSTFSNPWLRVGAVRPTSNASMHSLVSPAYLVERVPLLDESGFEASEAKPVG